MGETIQTVGWARMVAPDPNSRVPELVWDQQVRGPTLSHLAVMAFFIFYWVNYCLDERIRGFLPAAEDKRGFRLTSLDQAENKCCKMSF